MQFKQPEERTDYEMCQWPTFKDLQEVLLNGASHKCSFFFKKIADWLFYLEYQIYLNILDL